MCPSHTVTFLDLVLNFGYQLEDKIRRYAKVLVFEEEKERNKQERRKNKTKPRQDRSALTLEEFFPASKSRTSLL